MKKIASISALALAALLLAGCGGDSEEYNQPGTQTYGNDNGMVITLDLAELSENINYFSSTNSLGVPTISSLDVWTDISQETDSSGETYTFKLASLSSTVPYIEAAVYDEAATIEEVRVVWDESSAAADPDTFRDFCIALTSAVSGVDYETSASMYSVAYESQYENGVSETITYAYTGSIRCFYMINEGYCMLVIEPFSSDVQASEVESGTVVYTAVDTSGTETTADSTMTESEDSTETTDSTDEDAAETTDDSTDATDDSSTDGDADDTSAEDTSESSDETESTDDSDNIPVTSSE